DVARAGRRRETVRSKILVDVRVGVFLGHPPRPDEPVVEDVDRGEDVVDGLVLRQGVTDAAAREPGGGERGGDEQAAFHGPTPSCFPRRKLPVIIDLRLFHAPVANTRIIWVTK